MSFVPKKNRKKGYSLLELMFCIPTLAIAALGVLSVLSYGAVASDTAGEFSAATQYGREIVENIRADRFNFNPLGEISDLQAIGLVDESVSDRTPLNAPPLDQSTITSLPANDRFTRNIQVVHLIPNRLARIQVRVFYRARKGQERYVETVALAREAF